MLKTKQCSKCKKLKGLDAYNKNKSQKDGLEHECRECKTERMRLSRATLKAQKQHNENKQKMIDEVKQLIVEIEAKPTLWQRFKAWFI